MNKKGRYWFILLACFFTISNFCFGAGWCDKDGKLIFLRGVGFSPWHKTEGWNRSEETIKLDIKFLKDVHANALRVWGPASPEGVKANLSNGFYTLPTVHCEGGMSAEFSNGSKHSIAFSDPETQQKFAQQCEEYAEKIKGIQGVPAVLLGNEYTGVGYNSATKNYEYVGFEAPTQERFRTWLAKRFKTIESLNKYCGTNFKDFKEVTPLATRRLRYEFWLFQNRSFEEFIKAGHDAIKRVDSERLTSYGKLMGNRWDPCTEDAQLSFLDFPGDQIYWHWIDDWAKFNRFVNDFIATGKGKPVLITETGISTFNKNEDYAARLLKQNIWNVLLHPEVAGIFVFEYCDEWYKGCKPDELDHQEDGWGLVTADRIPKKSYYVLKEIYEFIEKMNDFFVNRQSTPVVAVSNQSLDFLVADKGTGLPLEIDKVLYSKGVSFRHITPDDVYDLSPEKTPRIIFCDEYFNCEPDGSRSALTSFLNYLEKGGKVLYLCTNPWQLPYGKANIPEPLRFDTSKTELTEVNYGKGTIYFLPKDKFNLKELSDLLLQFLKETGAPEVLNIQNVEPVEKQFEVFCRMFKSKDRQIILIVNSSDKIINNFQIDVLGVKWAKLLFADGATLSSSQQENVLHLNLQNIDTYALVEVGN
ncbi:MAG: beta-galactosidase [bacterium]|nr:beta-galactosidase [bacterium]